MTWDGSGNFIRGDGTRTGSTVWQQARDASIKIVATGHDAHDEDIASGLENCVTRDGQNSPSADLPMATFKHTGVGNAAARNSYAAAGQVQDSSFLWGGTTGGTSTAYTISVSPAISAYVAGQRFAFKLHTTCGATPTLNINGVGAVALKSGTTPTALGAGALLSGQIAEVLYDGTQFVSLHGTLAEQASNAVDIDGGTVSGIVIDGNISYSGSRSILASATGGGVAIGGGTSIGTSAASVELYENTSGFNAGGFTLKTGNVAGANGDITNQSATGTIDINLNGQERWQFQPDGDLSGEVNNGGNIIFNRDERGVVDTLASAVTAAGTLQGDATQLTKTVNFVSTATANQGVKLSATITPPRRITVFNRSGAAIRVYPGSGHTIDAGAADIHITLPDTEVAVFVGITATAWYRER